MKCRTRNRQQVTRLSPLNKIVLRPLLCSVVLLAGCSSLAPSIDSSIHTNVKNPEIADRWRTLTGTTKTTATPNETLNSNTDASTQAPLEDKSASRSIDKSPNPYWLSQFNSRTLVNAVNKALRQNHQILEQQAIVAQAEQQLIIAAADQGLNLDLSGNGTRQNSNSTISNSFSLGLTAKWQPDIWGQLNRQSRIAQQQLALNKANLQRAKRKLSADVTSAWYKLVLAQDLEALFALQQQNLTQQLAAVESSYQQGLTTSLDIYLARNNLDSAQAKTVSQQQTRKQAARTLELLLADYPSGETVIKEAIPTITSDISLGVPSDLLHRRADLNSAWLAILIEDSQVAVQYLNRFPQFNLTGNLSLSNATLGSLLSQNLAWSLIGAVNQTIYDNGKKQAQYDQAKAKLIQREQQYLVALQNAVAEVEGLIDSTEKTQQRYQLNQQALVNARFAENQVQAQYQNGIANYTQVLDVQRRHFDAQQAVVQLKAQLIDNRIALMLALGGAIPPLATSNGVTTSENLDAGVPSQHTNPRTPRLRIPHQPAIEKVN